MSLKAFDLMDGASADRRFSGSRVGCRFAESFRRMRVAASAAVAFGTSSYCSARYRAGPLRRIRIRFGLQRTLTGIAGSSSRQPRHAIAAIAAIVGFAIAKAAIACLG